MEVFCWLVLSFSWKLELGHGFLQTAWSAERAVYCVWDTSLTFLQKRVWILVTTVVGFLSIHHSRLGKHIKLSIARHFLNQSLISLKSIILCIWKWLKFSVLTLGLFVAQHWQCLRRFKMSGKVYRSIYKISEINTASYTFVLPANISNWGES